MGHARAIGGVKNASVGEWFGGEGGEGEKAGECESATCGGFYGVVRVGRPFLWVTELADQRRRATAYTQNSGTENETTPRTVRTGTVRGTGHSGEWISAVVNSMPSGA